MEQALRNLPVAPERSVVSGPESVAGRGLKSEGQTEKTLSEITMRFDPCIGAEPVEAPLILRLPKPGIGLRILLKLCLPTGVYPCGGPGVHPDPVISEPFVGAGPFSREPVESAARARAASLAPGLVPRRWPIPEYLCC